MSFAMLRSAPSRYLYPEISMLSEDEENGSESSGSDEKPYHMDADGYGIKAGKRRSGKKPNRLSREPRQRHTANARERDRTNSVNTAFTAHRAGRQKALQDRDLETGLQLHLAPGERAAGGGGVRGRAALPHHPGLLPPRRRQPRRARLRELPAQTDLHFLPQQPEEAEQRPRQEDGDSEL
ncbi:basic helix-loop-helix transcription factor scleraxis, partial [Columba livia]